MSNRRLFGPDGQPLPSVGTAAGSPGMFAGRLSGRPTQKTDDQGNALAEPEPRDLLMEAEFIVPSGDHFVAVAVLIQQMATVLRGRATIRTPIMKVRVFVDRAAREAAAMWLEKLVGITGGDVVRKFEGPAAADGGTK